MQLGMIGLGRMGANLVRRLMRDGHRCVVYNRSPGRTEELQGEGAEGAFTLQELVAKLERPPARPGSWSRPPPSSPPWTS